MAVSGEISAPDCEAIVSFTFSLSARVASKSQPMRLKRSRSRTTTSSTVPATIAAISLVMRSGRGDESKKNPSVK